MIGIPFGIEEKKFDITRAEEREELTEEAAEQLLQAADNGSECAFDALNRLNG